MDRAVGLISLQGGAGRSHEVSVGGYRLLLKAKLLHSGLAAGGGAVEGRAVQITAYYQGPDMRVVGKKTYVRCYHRAAPDGAWQPIVMDLAKV